VELSRHLLGLAIQPGGLTSHHEPMSHHQRAAPARLLFAHLAASVFIGSMLSHFRQTSVVRPVRSVIAINRLLHPRQRLISIGNSDPACMRGSVPIQCNDTRGSCDLGRR
jgi:hypothetical protein